MAIIRYPGSKAKLARAIIRLFPDSHQHSLWSDIGHEYREPFFGAGAIGLRVLSVLDRRCSVWLNDVDNGIVSLWRAVHECPKHLCSYIQNFEPSVDWFNKFKAEDGTPTGDLARDGFRKLALHRMSVSGFGAMSGGPIGGKTQATSQYTVGCRWTPSRIKREVMQTHKLMSKFANLRITCGDFRELLAGAGDECFIYLDPPYYEKGKQLYKYNTSQQDHQDLADLLRVSRARWVLSYDDHPEIRRLYSWATFHELLVTYSNAVCRDGKRPKNKEVAITPMFMSELRSA